MGVKRNQFYRRGWVVVAMVFFMMFVAGCGTQTAGRDASSMSSTQGGSDASTQTPNQKDQDSAKTGGDTDRGMMIKIGITQIISHPALDSAKEGFIAALKDNGYEEGNNVVYEIQNAEGSQDTALQIANKFVSSGVDLILAIATPSAQAVQTATEGTSIPVLFTAVTDPVNAGLVQTLEAPGGHITGTTDMNPIREQLELITSLTDGKRVGIIYNSGESNSQVQVDIAKKEAQALGLTILEKAITNTSEVKQAAESLVGKVDAIYVPTDNTVVSALQSVLSVAEANHIPVVAGEGESVKEGALVTYGIDYYRLGYQTGEMAVRILKGEQEPKTMPVESQKDLKLYVNVTAAQKAGIELPKEWLERADVKY